MSGDIGRRAFMDLLWRYRRSGSISRRHFLGASGLGLALAAMARPTAAAEAAPRRGGRIILATWPNYHAPETLRAFTEATGIAVDLEVFGANEDMMASLRAGTARWGVFIPTNYALPIYHQNQLLKRIDTGRLPHFAADTQDHRFAGPGRIGGVTYGVPKHWGTTGFAVDIQRGGPAPESWAGFWQAVQTRWSGRAIVHDYQLTAIGNALKCFGYSFNSLNREELARAEALLLNAKPHLAAITSDYGTALASGKVWASMAWSGDIRRLRRHNADIVYVLGREGGEIWTDYFAIPACAPDLDLSHALIDFLVTPRVAAVDAMLVGYALTDSRANRLLPREALDDPILYPAVEALSTLEFGAAATMTDPYRAEIMARFRAA